MACARVRTGGYTEDAGLASVHNIFFGNSLMRVSLLAHLKLCVLGDHASSSVATWLLSCLVGRGCSF